MTESGSPFPVPVAGTHTSTPQWQNFEVRMRRRRAERCLMRADLAFSAGFIEDARAATDEAKELDPAWPAVAAMEERLAEAVILPELMLRTGPVEIAVGPNNAEKSGHRFLLTVALACASVALVAVASLGWRAGRTRWDSRRARCEVTRRSPRTRSSMLSWPHRPARLRSQSHLRRLRRGRCRRRDWPRPSSQRQPRCAIRA